MMIRQAVEGDISEIKAVIDSLQVSRDQEGWERRTYGFFEYTKTQEELLKALNPHFTVAESSDGIRGFCLAYDDSFLREVYGDSKNPSLRFLFENYGENYLYADMLGVVNPGSLYSSKVANLLVDEGVDMSVALSLDKIVTFICLEPYFNSGSDKYFIRKGFRLVGDISFNNVVLGVYELIKGKGISYLTS